METYDIPCNVFRTEITFNKKSNLINFDFLILLPKCFFFLIITIFYITNSLTSVEHRNYFHIGFLSLEIINSEFFKFTQVFWANFRLLLNMTHPLPLNCNFPEDFFFRILLNTVVPKESTEIILPFWYFFTFLKKIFFPVKPFFRIWAMSEESYIFFNLWMSHFPYKV